MTRVIGLLLAGVGVWAFLAHPADLEFVATGAICAVAGLWLLLDGDNPHT
jgi:hypothetical protein